jgi:RNA polymerase sigma factor (sigma-70 family)
MVSCFERCLHGRETIRTPRTKQKGRLEEPMKASPYAESAIGCNVSDSNTYVPLLQNTQAYLQSLLQRRAPDTVLAEAWEEFYRVYDGLIRRFVVAYGIRDADVDDCVQDVWSEVAARLADFRRPKNHPGLRAWLYTLARSKATDVLRHKARHSAWSLDKAIRVGNEPCANEPNPAEVCQRKCENALLAKAMAELRTKVSRRSYRLLEMRLVENRSVREVATAFGLTPEQVRSRQYRVLRKLRARMALYVGELPGEDVDV